QYIHSAHFFFIIVTFAQNEQHVDFFHSLCSSFSTKSNSNMHAYRRKIHRYLKRTVFPSAKQTRANINNSTQRHCCEVNLQVEWSVRQLFNGQKSSTVGDASNVVNINFISDYQTDPGFLHIICDIVNAASRSQLTSNGRIEGRWTSVVNAEELRSSVCCYTTVAEELKYIKSYKKSVTCIFTSVEKTMKVFPRRKPHESFLICSKYMHNFNPKSKKHQKHGAKYAIVK
ncbi:hypothetical protein L9F63_002622, partial [Diploptera punctata]